MIKIVTLSGWGQDYKSLDYVFKDANHINYAAYPNIESLFEDIKNIECDILIGWSLGGQIALKAVADGIIKPKRLVLLSTPFEFINKDNKEDFIEFRQKFINKPNRLLREFSILIAKNDKKHKKILKTLNAKYDILKDNLLYWLDFLQNFSAKDIFILNLYSIKIIHGKEDQVVNISQADNLAKNCKNAKVILINDCAHAPHLHDGDILYKMVMNPPLNIIENNKKYHQYELENINKNKLAICNSFNKSASKYDQYATLQRQIARDLFNLIKRDFKDNQYILDLGSGTGFIQELIRSIKCRAFIVQLDIAFNMCKIAKKYSSSGKFGSSHVINADIDYLPFHNNKFDYLISSMALQWSENIEKSIFNIDPILKNDAVFAYSIVGKDSLYELKNSFLHIGRKNRINNFISKYEIDQILKKHKYKNIIIYEKTYIQEFDNLSNLIKSLKNIGASSIKNREKINKEFIGKKDFIELENFYRKNYAKNGKLLLSWNILFVIGEKCQNHILLQE